MLPITLVVVVLAFPGLHFVAGYFSTETECKHAAAAIDASTPVRLRLTCEVAT